MAGKPKYDWESLRKLYVSGEVDELVELSRDRTGNMDLPDYANLRKRAARENWKEQRRFYNRELAAQVVANAATKVTQSATSEEVSRKAEELIDNVEAIVRHIKLGRLLQNKAFLRLKDLDITRLSIKDMIAMIQLGTELERKALALYEPKQHAQIDVEVNFEALTTGELEMVKQAIAKSIPAQVGNN